MDAIPYSRQDISEDDIAAVTRVLRSDWLTQGPVLPAFEAAFAERHGVAHAVAVSNATAALHLACLALGIADLTALSHADPPAYGTIQANIVRILIARLRHADERLRALR